MSHLHRKKFLCALGFHIENSIKHQFDKYLAKVHVAVRLNIFIEHNQRDWTQVMTTLDSPLPNHKLLTRHGTMGQALIFCINKTNCMYEICYSSNYPVND